MYNNSAKPKGGKWECIVLRLYTKVIYHRKWYITILTINPKATTKKPKEK